MARPFKFNYDREWLWQKYHTDLMPVGQIAQLCNVSSDTIWIHMRRFQITLRKRSQSEATRERIRVAHKGKKLSQEHRKNLSLAHVGNKSALGHKLSEEVKRLIGEQHCGNKYRLGKKHSEETKKLISKALKTSSKVLRGENHPNWNEGSSRGYKWESYKNNRDYRIWREAIYKRDDYTCQSCKQRGGHLAPHHIKSWTKYPTLRFEVNNGITLCESCHALTYNYKGRRQYALLSL